MNRPKGIAVNHSITLIPKTISVSQQI
jgi:hypothetical protein